MILILAATRQAARDLAARFGLEPHQWLYPTRLEDWHVVDKPIVLAADGWKLMDTSFEIAGLLRARRAEVWWRK